MLCMKCLSVTNLFSIRALACGGIGKSSVRFKVLFVYYHKMLHVVEYFASLFEFEARVLFSLGFGFCGHGPLLFSAQLE